MAGSTDSNVTAQGIKGIRKEQKYQSQSTGEVVNIANYNTRITKDQCTVDVYNVDENKAIF